MAIAYISIEGLGNDELDAEELEAKIKSVYPEVTVSLDDCEYDQDPNAEPQDDGRP